METSPIQPDTWTRSPHRKCDAPDNRSPPSILTPILVHYLKAIHRRIVGRGFNGTSGCQPTIATEENGDVPPSRIPAEVFSVELLRLLENLEVIEQKRHHRIKVGRGGREPVLCDDRKVRRWSVGNSLKEMMNHSVNGQFKPANDTTLRGQTNREATTREDSPLHVSSQSRGSLQRTEAPGRSVCSVRTAFPSLHFNSAPHG